MGQNRFTFFTDKNDQSMPHELKSLEDLTDEILNRTIAVLTKRSGEYVKFKIRTKKTLFTLKVKPDEASGVENKINSSDRPIEIIPQ